MKNLHDHTVGRDIYITVLGICPLLVMANTVQSGWAMGVVYLSAILLVSLFLSGIRNLVPVALRLTAVVLVSATMLSLVDAFMQAWFYEISLKLGIFIPLIAMNCLLLARAEEIALRNNLRRSCFHGLVGGCEILLIMLVLGAVREYSGLDLLRQPPGVFLLLALLIAGVRWYPARGGQAATVAR